MRVQVNQPYLFRYLRKVLSLSLDQHKINLYSSIS